MAAPVAWIAYLPVPGLALVPVLVEPEDRHVRFHAWQGTGVVLLAYAGLVLLGLILGIAAAWFQVVVAALSAVWLLLALLAMTWGIVSAARGRFDRIWPVADLLSLLGR